MSVAKSPAYEALRPPEYAAAAEWQNDGYKVDLDYQDLSPALDVPVIAKELRALLPAKYSPLTRQSRGTQGYLFSLPAQAGRFLLEAIDPNQRAVDGRSIDEKIEHSIAVSPILQTTKVALIESRLGQGMFRTNQIRFWQGACAVTGLNSLALLRASHIKPWRDSNNAERLDVFNGLLLAANYDVAFDLGLITFTLDGKIVLSPALSPTAAAVLNVNANAKLSKVEVRHVAFLKHHNADVFKAS